MERQRYLGTGRDTSRTESTHYSPIHLVDSVDGPGHLLGGGNRAVNRTNGCPCPHGHHQLRESESDTDAVAWRGEIGPTLEMERWQWK